MEISSELLKILVCPVTKKSLQYDKHNQELISTEAGLAYPVKDGIPILLVERARKISKGVTIDEFITSTRIQEELEEKEEEFELV